MNHRLQVRAAQDRILRESLAGSSLSALTLVVALMLAAQLFPRQGPEFEPKVYWPPDHEVIVVLPPPGGSPPPPVTPPAVAGFIPGLDEQADTVRVEPEPPAIRGIEMGDDFGEPRGPVGPGGGDPGPVIEPEIPPPGVYVPHDEIPVVARRVVPDYPDLARQAGMEGEVVVQIFVGVDGRVRRAEIVTPASIFDQSALEAVRQWVFSPAKANGHPVGVWMAVPIVFRLH